MTDILVARFSKIREANTWCQANIDPNSWDRISSNPHFMSGESVVGDFRFKHDHDAVVFKLMFGDIWQSNA
jgi:hypothetical protein